MTCETARLCLCARACMCVSRGGLVITALLLPSSAVLLSPWPIVCLRPLSAAVALCRYASWVGSKQLEAAGLFDGEREQLLVDRLFLICRVKLPPTKYLTRATPDGR